jgi:hypothetical protein
MHLGGKRVASSVPGAQAVTGCGSRYRRSATGGRANGTPVTHNGLFIGGAMYILYIVTYSIMFLSAKVICDVRTANIVAILIKRTVSQDGFGF